MENKTMAKGPADLLGANRISAPQDRPTEIEVILIDPNPFQPRQRFDEDSLRELADSIKKYGVLQPVLLRKKDEDRYELVAGERRLRASRLAGLRTVPALVRDVTDTQSLEIAVIENIQREDIGPIETARAYKRLVEDFGYTQEHLAGVVGKSRSSVANHLRLLSLPEPVLAMLEDKSISEGHARAVLSVSSEENRVPFAERIVRENLTVRDAEELARIINNPLGDMSEPEPEKPARPAVSRETTELADLSAKLKEALKTGVRVVKRRTKGQIVIEFKNDSDLERLLSQILGEEH
ncbi:MAG: ParB/RepB/Spo0J family partition protein [Abditibacteriota bacterium]|nr:ParB/RepB/Spo0J family partition protein [Abditibacteriota bacterium]